jgi:hypothetical protein
MRAIPKARPMRIVFLDFDGVLNTRALVERAPAPLAIGLDLLDAAAVTRLERFCVEVNAEIVITSTWRLTFDRAALEDMLRAKGLAMARVRDVTPMIPHKRGRGQEIQHWLDTAVDAQGSPPLEAIVILDDDPDMLHLMPWLVQTSFETGLTDADLDAAKIVFRRRPPSFR